MAATSDGGQPDGGGGGGDSIAANCADAVAAANNEAVNLTTTPNASASLTQQPTSTRRSPHTQSHTHGLSVTFAPLPTDDDDDNDQQQQQRQRQQQQQAEAAIGTAASAAATAASSASVPQPPPPLLLPSNNDQAAAAEFDTQQLIAAVHKRPMLYSKADGDYLNKAKKDQTWERIGAKFGTTAKNVRTKWSYLRDKFVKELRRTTARTDGRISSWPHFQAMMFVRDSSKRKSSVAHHHSAASPSKLPKSSTSPADAGVVVAAPAPADHESPANVGAMPSVSAAYSALYAAALAANYHNIFSTSQPPHPTTPTDATANTASIGSGMPPQPDAECESMAAAATAANNNTGSSETGPTAEPNVKALIAEIRKRPMLYSRDDPHYQNKQRKEECWLDIFTALEGRMTIKQMKSKWTYLRDKLVKELKKSTRTRRKSESRWIYFDSMAFVRDANKHYTDAENECSAISYEAADSVSHLHTSGAEIDIDLLISEILKRPVLYDYNDESYRDLEIRDRVWEEIASLLGDHVSIEEVQMQWSLLRERFAKELLRTSRATNRGVRVRRRWEHFDKMMLMNECCEMRQPPRSGSGDGGGGGRSPGGADDGAVKPEQSSSLYFEGDDYLNAAYLCADFSHTNGSENAISVQQQQQQQHQQQHLQQQHQQHLHQQQQHHQQHLQHMHDDGNGPNEAAADDTKENGDAGNSGDADDDDDDEMPQFPTPIAVLSPSPVAADMNGRSGAADGGEPMAGSSGGGGGSGEISSGCDGGGGGGGGGGLNYYNSAAHIEQAVLRMVDLIASAVRRSGGRTEDSSGGGNWGTPRANGAQMVSTSCSSSSGGGGGGGGAAVGGGGSAEDRSGNEPFLEYVRHYLRHTSLANNMELKRLVTQFMHSNPTTSSD